MKRKGTVLQCHADMSEMVTLSEIGMSTAILEAGYNLDCLMLRYQVCASACLASMLFRPHAFPPCTLRRHGCHSAANASAP